MKRPAPDDDATVVMRRGPAPPAPPPPKQRSGAAFLTAGAAAVVVVAGLAVWWLLPSHRAAPPPVPASVAPRHAVVPRPAVPPAKPVRPPAPSPAPPVATITADEATIRDHVADRLTVFRFAPDPAVVVLDFPTLHMQGQMLNRLAALIEKAGAPRDRVLNDAELDAAIRKGGDTPDTYYYGHDYPAADVVRLFTLADAEHVRLNAEEERLRAMAKQFGWFAPGAVGAVISVPRVPEASVPALDAAARATILRHELSHGLFFTDPVYSAYVKQFWDTTLTEAERSTVRKFLGSEGYDTSDEVLVYNEMQAYVMFTYDKRFCKAADFGMTPARRLEVAEAFLRDMPPNWLRDMLAQGIDRLR